MFYYWNRFESLNDLIRISHKNWHMGLNIYASFFFFFNYRNFVMVCKILCGVGLLTRDSVMFYLFELFCVTKSHFPHIFFLVNQSPIHSIPFCLKLPQSILLSQILLLLFTFCSMELFA